MNIFPLEEISALISASVLAFAFKFLIDITLKKRSKDKPKKISDLLNEKLHDINQISQELDLLLKELSNDINKKNSKIHDLEIGLNNLTKRETELKNRISYLENVPIQIVEEFKKTLEPNERRNIKRDYLLFFLGVLVTTLISIFLNVFLFKK